MNIIVAIILTIVLSVASATAGTCHYRDYLGSTRAVVGLAHELLGHGWDYSQGFYLDRTEFKINGVSINEIRAINIENQVREYLKIPKRTSYGGQKIF